MATPTTAFADAAAKYGDVDPEDIEQVLHDLLSRDGEAPDRELVPVYPERAPLPSLGASPQVTPPLLADEWRRIVARLLNRLRGR